MYRPNLYEKPEPGAPGKPTSSGKGGEQGAPDKLVAQYWREIERYKRATSSWHEEGEQIERLYLDEDRTQNSARRFALLWANVETLKPAVYAKPPVVMCSRRYKDRDPIARIAAELMERATNTTFDLYNIDETFQMVRDDRLLPGRGQAWVRYEADIEQYEADAAGDDEDGTDGEGADEVTEDANGEPAIHEKVTAERVCTDYVHWTDFGHNVAGAWNDVWLVWRATYKTEDEAAGRFGPEMAAKLNYDAKAPASTAEKSASSMGENAEDFCKIIEVWDKRRKLVSWISEGLHGRFIESGPPPVNFSNFFPCPKPCYATKTSKSLIPRPDYIYYRDQAKEINDLTAKIANMTDWLVVKGFVPGAPSRVSDAIEEVIRDKGNREMFTQVESWTEWTERGGIAKLIDWMPIDMIIKTLQAAIQARTQLIQDVFQITGISDILRGQTDPVETLGAQELKAQTGSRRLRNTKDELARFCRDVARLNAEIIAEKFEPETIAAITGYRYQPPPPKPIALPGLGAPLASNILPMAPGYPTPMPSGQPGVPPMPGGPPQMPPPPPPGVQPQGMVGGNGAMKPAAAGAMGGVNPPGAAAAPPSMPPAAPPGAPPTLAPMPQGGAPVLPQQPMGMNADQQQGTDMVFDDRVIKLLRNDRLRSFRVDVETDSTGQADEQAEKQSRTEFLTAVGPYLEKAVQAIQVAPETAGMVGEMLMYVVRGFRAGRSLEEEIERTFEQLKQKALAAAQQPPQPSPEEMKAKAATEAMQQQTQAEQQRHEQGVQATQAKAAADAQALTQKAAFEQQAHDQAMQAAQQKADADRAVAEEKMRLIELQTQQAIDEHNMRMQHMEKEAELKQQDAELRREDMLDKADERRSAAEFSQAERAAKAKADGGQASGGEPSEGSGGEANLEEFMGEIAKRFAETQAQIAALAKPRKVSITRGPDGRATGAVSAFEQDEPPQDGSAQEGDDGATV